MAAKKKKIVTGGNEGDTILVGGACCEDHKTKSGYHDVEKIEEEWFPATKNMPCKPIKCDGDAKHCKTCNANTSYKGLCAVCGIKSEETRMKHEGNLNYLKVKYSHYVNVK